MLLVVVLSLHLFTMLIVCLNHIFYLFTFYKNNIANLLVLLWPLNCKQLGTILGLLAVVRCVFNSGPD